ncbi:hypothetical protein NUW58_g6401 [Xylaria curta]|uniref:Uncharacterized protein n=1 Tax=Xylaria curta TaxID=42375 RepID=A0ACC1NUQ3_9PEZI|nr:hypothetical protein NUW58_g6401 [Xylaria curta]
MKSPLTTASTQKSSARGRNKVVVLDETLPQTQGQPVIINNYVGADSGDSEGERSRTRSRRQRRRYNNVELYEHDEDDSDSRAHRRHRSGRASSPSLVSFSTSEDEYSDDVYNFTPSYASVSSESLKDRAPSADSSTPFLATIGASPPRTAKTMYIYKSQYTGDAFHEGNHASKLTLLHDPRHPQQALFRWIHIKQPVMNFDAFWDEIAGITNLTSSEKNGIKRLLQDVKSRGIRRVVTAHGSHRVMQTNGFPMRRLQSGDTETPTSRPKAVYWVNLPFFELKEYSSEKYSSELFPAQTLMQADYSQHLKARDMQQAVQQIKEGSGEQCFHISQLWGIIVDNSLLVTCSTMSDDKLGKTSIETKSVPPKEKNGESDELRILVEYRESTLWAIPLRECLTWFEFTTHFWEFWPDNLHFYRHRKLLSSNDWPDIVESVQQGTKRVLLEAIIKPLPILPTRGVLAPIVELKASAKQSDSDGVSTNRTDEAAGGLTASTPSGSTVDELPQESESFSVFAWIKASPEFSRTVTIRAELERVDRFVRKRTRRNDQRAYSECPEATPDEVRAELERLAVEKNLLELDEESKLQRELRDRIDIFNSADDFTLTEPRIHCYQRPWPEDNNEAQSLNWTKRQRVANSNLYIARKDLRGIARQVLLFQRVMSHAPDPNKAGIEIPVQLLQAYIYFVLALIRASVDTNPDWSYMRTVSSLLQTGMRAILKSFSPASLLTYSSILPTEVLSLISLGLLNDLTGPYPDIYTVYSEWIKTLENEIETKPALSHQEKIRWLLVEINVIIETLEKQKSIFDDIIRGRTSSYRAVVPEQSYDLRHPLHIQYNNAPDRTLTRARSRERYRETKNSAPSRALATTAPRQQDDAALMMALEAMDSASDEEIITTYARPMPVSPSYFSRLPQFNDSFVHVQELARKYARLPTLHYSQVERVAWKTKDQYRLSIGEHVKARDYATCIALVKRLHQIHPDLIPEEVTAGLRPFKRDINIFLNRPKPIPIDRFGRSHGVGKRKSSVARAWLVEGTGEVLINGKPMNEAFGRIHDRESALWGLKSTDRLDKYNVWALVGGGGSTGQAEALALAIAKALVVHEPPLKTPLRRGKSTVENNQVSRGSRL